tara:strand:+ start:271 stop:504 length:234 start_codon:yes stop_codon:yes gene_type:complete
MPVTEAQKRANLKYRENNRAKINSINNKSNIKRYRECEERKEKMKENSRQQYIRKKEKALEEKEKKEYFDLITKDPI